tara:strand:+ start:1130 stop:2257 length:1128 start_codon:yes stop_codon:yes gene_type:complete
MSTLNVDSLKTLSGNGIDAQIVSIGGGGLSHRNKFINGAMTISQRATSYTSLSDNQYTLDRFKHIIRGTNDSHYTQVSDHPDNFTKSMKVKCNSTYTPSASDNAGFQSMLEGQDLQDLNFGSANANSFTVSFYAKSASQNNNHQYTFQIRTFPSGGATSRIKNFPFTVTTSWQRFTFTFTGDTGADIRNDNQLGMALLWNLNAGPDDITSQYTDWTTLGKFMCVTGQSNFLDNTNNEFYLTGVQLEVGDTATTFEHRSFGDELTRCQRYFQRIPSAPASSNYYFLANGAAHDTNAFLCNFHFPTTMRSNPSLSTTGNLRGYNGGGLTISSIILNSSSVAGACVQVATSSGLSAKDSVSLGQNNDSDASVQFTAEL